MGVDSKKRQELKRQLINRAQTADLPLIEKVISFLRFPKKYKILEKTTIVPGEEQIETQKFIICFDYLNWNECCLDQINKTIGDKLIGILEKVSKCKIEEFPGLKLVRDSVEKIGPYESLFSQLSTDVTRLDETELGNGRIFFFITEPYFNIVSIETKHRG